MTNHKVKCSNFEIANDSAFTLIAGPCQLENEAHAIKISTELKKITSDLGINLIYKTSFDKANRTSLKGKRGTEGKIAAINYARKNQIPFLGICFGMQMAVIEFARNKLNIKNATSSEFGSSKASVVGLMSEWVKDGKLMKGTDKDLGGTMRLGSYEARLKKDTKISKIYKSLKIEERHRHRYEVNINYKEDFENKGMIF